MNYFFIKGVVSGPNLTKLKGLCEYGVFDPHPKATPPVPIKRSGFENINPIRKQRINYS